MRVIIYVALGGEGARRKHKVTADNLTLLWRLYGNKPLQVHTVYWIVKKRWFHLDPAQSLVRTKPLETPGYYCQPGEGVISLLLP